VPALSAGLTAEPRFGGGSGDQHPRSVRLWLKIGASGGARFDTTSIHGWFSSRYGRRSVLSAPCGHRPLPRLIGPADEEVSGCLAFTLPGGPGSLQIRGDGPAGHPFAYYLPVGASGQ
jgi:hypothetical protein